MKNVIILILSFLAGCCVLGCRMPVANYTLQTRCPDIWDETPAQEISIKMDFRR